MIYVENDSLEAAFSFALEVYLLRELDLGEDVVLFWRTQPTLMIGRYQNAEAEVNLAHAQSRGVPVVRRITGGGTIYTDLNGWQYSFLSRRKRAAGIDFATYIGQIVAALQTLGVAAYASDRNDIFVDGRKVSGNAQYQRADALLHHGSLLFATDLEEMVRLLTPSEDKLISKGIRSVRQRVTNIAEHLPEPMDALAFRDRMLEKMLGPGTRRYALTGADRRRVEELADEQFRNWRWNHGNSPAFALTRSGRFAGGKIEFGLNVKGGAIAQCSVHGDFFATGDMEELEAALTGCPFRPEDVRAALGASGAVERLHQISLEDILQCLFG